MANYQTEIIAQAQAYAYRMHDGLHSITLSGFKRPQLLHIQEVADLVWVSGGTYAEIAAAWLHDSVEDTAATHQQIEELFGKDVAEIVSGLTDFEEWEKLPLAERKSKQAERIKNESISVRRVKLADQTSNVKYVAFDAPTNMTYEERMHYIQGAKKIADGCRGISPLLDTLFDQVYEIGAHRYKPSTSA